MTKKPNKTDQFPVREWKKVTRSLDPYTIGGTLADVCRAFKEATKGLKGVDIGHVAIDYESYEFEIAGYQKRTKKEIAEFDKEEVAKAERARKRKEAAEKRRAGKPPVDQKLKRDMETLQRLAQRRPNEVKQFAATI